MAAIPCTHKDTAMTPSGVEVCPWCYQTEIEMLIHERDVVRALLREFQWGGYLKVCLSCGRSPEEGHNAICRIAAALEGR